MEWKAEKVFIVFLLVIHMWQAVQTVYTGTISLVFLLSPMLLMLPSLESTTLWAHLVFFSDISCLAVGRFFFFLRATAWDGSNHTILLLNMTFKKINMKAYTLFSFFFFFVFSLMHKRTAPLGPSLCSSLYTSEVTEIRPVDRNISFCLSSSGRFVFQTIFMRSHYFHFLSCHLVLGFFRSVHTGIAPVLIWSQGPSERKCISITKGYITKDWRFSTVKYHWFCSNASIFFYRAGTTYSAELEWEST